MPPALLLNMLCNRNLARTFQTLFSSATYNQFNHYSPLLSAICLHMFTNVTLLAILLLIFLLQGLKF